MFDMGLMYMKYTSKDVCKIYNINKETLRYYEKIGLIHPKVDKQNNYRYYDDWDFNAIGECRKMRSLEISIKDTREIINNYELYDFIKKIEEKQKDYENQILYYKRLSDWNSEYIEQVKSISDNLNKCKIIEVEESYYIPYRKNFEYIFEKEIVMTMECIMENYAFFQAAFYILKEDYESNNEIVFWGHSIKRKFSEYLNLELPVKISFPKQKVIYSIIDAGERWNFNYHLFDYMKDYIRKKGYHQNGPIYGNILIRIHNNDKYCRYIEVFIPIE